MRGYYPWEQDNKKDVDPYKLFYQFFGAMLIIIGLLWLTWYKIPLLQTAKFAFIAGGFLWGKAPSLKQNTDNKRKLTLSNWVIIVLACVLNAYGFVAPVLAELGFGQFIHWSAGGISLSFGTKFLVQKLSKSGEDEAKNNSNRRIID
ncbi:MAG: hypothetical protein P9X24_12105 [Candidatus Hatepunaea meridiana]|nr:hypothetical protein [Candidatus Hatepunaea meridiana]